MKYYLEIDVYGTPVPDSSRCCYETIVAEGDTFEEVLNSATVNVVDDDGGDRGIYPADANWMQLLISNKFYEEYPA